MADSVRVSLLMRLVLKCFDKQTLGYIINTYKRKRNVSLERQGKYKQLCPLWRNRFQFIFSKSSFCKLCTDFIKVSGYRCLLNSTKECKLVCPPFILISLGLTKVCMDWRCGCEEAWLSPYKCLLNFTRN